MEIAIQKILLQILLWILKFIDGVFTVFGAVAGINPVQTSEGQETTSLVTYFLEQSVVAQAFWIVLIASVGICAVCAVVAVVKAIVNTKGGEPKSPFKTLGQAASTTLVTLIMAMFMVTGVWAADELLLTVNSAMNNGERQIISTRIIDISVEEAYLYDDDNVLGLNRYDEDGNCTFKSIMYKYAKESDGVTPKRFPEGGVVFLQPDEQEFLRYDQIYTDKPDPQTGKLVSVLDTSQLTPVKRENGGWLKDPPNPAEDPSYSILVVSNGIIDETVESLFGGHGTFVLPTSWNNDGKIAPDSFNFLVAFLCALIILIALLSSTLGLVKRIFDLILLFIVLPGIVATIPLDDGAKFKLWRETVVSKVFLAFGSVFAVNIFFIVSPMIWNITVMGASQFINTMFRLVLICGGALTISGGQLLFARLLGTSAEESREMSQSARTLLGGAGTAFGLSKGVGRLLFGTKNANGQRVGGLLKGGAGVAGAVGGGAINTVGTLAGGQAYKNSGFGQRVAKTQAALRNFSGSSGWFGRDKTTGDSTVFGAIGGRLAKTVDKAGGEKGRFGGMPLLGNLSQEGKAQSKEAKQSRIEKTKIAVDKAAKTPTHNKPLWK